MALHQRADGTGTINKVDATWWNEYYELLTGTMTDQVMTLANGISNIASGVSIANSTVKPPFGWAGVAGTAFIGVLDIHPSDAGQKHWMIAYNGGDQHLQIQQVTDNLDVVDIDTAGNVFLTKDLHVTGAYWGPAQISSEGVPAQTVIRSQPTTANLVIQVNGKNTLFRTDGLIVGPFGSLPQLVSAGGGAAGNAIWVGTADPGASAAEGDIWIKA